MQIKSFIGKALCAVLAVALLAASGCGVKQVSRDPSVATETAEIGEGETEFTLSVTHKDGSAKIMHIHTNGNILGEVLLSEGIVAGEKGPYGLYVKTVDGETLDYDTDGCYWALYTDGQYASAGIDNIEITDGGEYAFKAQEE